MTFLKTILNSPFFHTGAITFLTSFLVILVKKSSSRDEDIDLKSNDFAVGLEIYVVSIILLSSKFCEWQSTKLILTASLEERRDLSVWILAGSFIGLFIIVFSIRYFGWVRGYDESLSNTKCISCPEKQIHEKYKLHWFLGIWLPNVISIIYLIFITIWIGGK